jgi:hypothetical protein
MQPSNPQPLFITTAEYLGETQIDIRRIEIVPRYDRPPWKPVNGRQFDVRLTAFGPESAANAIERKRPERLTKTVANTSRYLSTDRRWETK